MGFINWDKPGLISPKSSFFHWFILTNVIISTLIAIFSAVAVILAQDVIVSDLAIEGSRASWITILYLLGINSTVPAANWFADRFGYKKLYFIGITIFAFASLMAGLAHGFWGIGIARLIEGIGAGFIFPVGMAILARNFPKEKLQMALNLYIGVAFGGGIIIGNLMGGYLSQYETWNLLFFITIPFSIFFLIATWLIHEESECKKIGKFDFWGFIFFVMFISSLLIALNNGNLPSTGEGWRSPFIITCFILAAIGLVMTIFIESHVENPIIPLVLFKDPIFSMSTLVLFTVGMSIFATMSLSAGYMENALGYERWEVGLVGISYGIALGLFSVLASILARKIPVPIISLFGLAVIIFSYFLNNILTWQSGKLAMIIILTLRGIGVALTIGPTTAQAMKRVPTHLSGESSTLLTFFRQVGGTYGGSVLGILVIRRNIFHNAMFSQQTNSQIVGYKETFNRINNHILTDTGSNSLRGGAQSKALIIEHINNQSYIQAINDALILFGYVTIIISIILLTLNLKEYFQNKKLSKTS